MSRPRSSGSRRAPGAAAVRLRPSVGLIALGLLLAGIEHAAAQTAPDQDPDWPCVQRKVPHLSTGAMWPGLTEEDLKADWRSDSEVAALVAEIAPRRVPIEEAEEAIRTFATGVGEAKKEEKLKRLFVGLFQMLDAERDEVIRGIERFATKQKQLVDRIIAERAALAELRKQSPPDQQALTEQSQKVTWSIRVFEDRRGSLTYVCEVPRVIEQRLFSFARAIRGELS